MSARSYLRDIVHDEVEIDLVGLFALAVEAVLQRDHVTVVHHAHDLKLAILHTTITTRRNRRKRGQVE